MMSKVAIPSAWIIPDWPVPQGICTLSTTRHGGVSEGAYAAFNVGTSVGDAADRVAANRVMLRSFLPDEPFWLRQVHGTHVVNADAILPQADPVEGDASLTRQPGRVLAIQAADCMPVLLASRAGGVVAAAHAGWRGMADGVIENAVAAMDVDPASLVAWLGPAIGAHAYEVGEDVHEAFLARDAAAASAFIPRNDRYVVDLYRIARQRLERLGVGSVHGGGYCTYSDPARFFSYRRDGTTGRMVTLIWMKS